jgi:glutamate--cysteine ligase
MVVPASMVMGGPVSFVRRHAATTGADVLRDVTQAEEHVAGICFKTGPPRRVGVELEFTAHLSGDPDAYLDVRSLREALGVHAPPSLQSADPPVPLPAGGMVTVEPGGQIEISSAPADSLAGLHAAVTTDLMHLTELLAAAGLVLGEHGLDPHRAPRRLLDSPRYAAMERTFDRRGRCGRIMMGSTAGLQVCLDAGTEDQLADRFATVSALGPVLTAVFANSRWHAGRDTGWASGRMGVWLGMDPRRTGPLAPAPDPAAGWAGYALAAPLLCVRRDGPHWDPPPAVTFADWIAGALPQPPTVDDLDYHLSTLFPPVRPRGYLEIRYLDAQPGGEWIAPAAVLASLLADGTTTAAVRALAEPVADRWRVAARSGLADPLLRAVAADILDESLRGMDRTGLPPATRDRVAEIVDERLHRPTERGRGMHR